MFLLSIHHWQYHRKEGVGRGNWEPLIKVYCEYMSSWTSSPPINKIKAHTLIFTLGFKQPNPVPHSPKLFLIYLIPYWVLSCSACTSSPMILTFSFVLSFPFLVSRCSWNWPHKKKNNSLFWWVYYVYILSIHPPSLVSEIMETFSGSLCLPHPITPYS